ncbi:MAG: acyl-CoA synthetase [Sphingomonadales bacterium]|nr:acyl-CoA synthetase [Sphingomonadales bacterium]
MPQSHRLLPIGRRGRCAPYRAALPATQCSFCRQVACIPARIAVDCGRRATRRRTRPVYPGTHARTRPDHPAVICPAIGQALSYRQLDEASNRLARVLHGAGLRTGDHVALLCENNAAFFVVTWACLRSGLYLTPINWHLSASEAAYILDDCDARALIASAGIAIAAEVARLAPDCGLTLALGGPIPGFADGDAACAAQPATPLPDETLGSLMNYSSGTTGKPKGIIRPLRGIHPAQGNPAITAITAPFDFTESTVYLSTAPLYHAGPSTFCTGTIQAGGTVVVMDRFEPEAALALVERHRITHSQWVPTMFVRLLKLPEAARARHDLSSHTCAIHAAAPCPAEVKRAMIAWWGPIIEEYYSSTETVAFTRISSAEWLAHPGSVGRSTGLPLHICDDDGRELAPGQPGLVYGEPPPGSAFVYHKAADKTGASCHPVHRHWMTVGDIGTLDGDGYLYLTDRQAFMIISGGVNIYPQQIEDALALHPAVTDVAVIGVPHDELGEVVQAVIEPAPDVVADAALAEAIIAFVAERLGRQLAPRGVAFVDALPRLPTGKLAKQRLRERYARPAPG